MLPLGLIGSAWLHLGYIILGSNCYKELLIHPPKKQLGYQNRFAIMLDKFWGVVKYTHTPITITAVPFKYVLGGGGGTEDSLGGGRGRILNYFTP